MISLIIPTYNEENSIGQLLNYLLLECSKEEVEILVVDGGSTDATREIVTNLNVGFHLASSKGRAAQLNYGASIARGDIYYFVHSDSLPPSGFVSDIKHAVHSGYPIGCYRFEFRSESMLLKVNAFFTRYDLLFFRGGDQTLFVTASVFKMLNGFDEKYCIMEEYDFLKRAKNKFKFRIIPRSVFGSARKYEHNSYLRVNLVNLIAVSMFRLGMEPTRIKAMYKRYLKHPKNRY